MLAGLASLPSGRDDEGRRQAADEDDGQQAADDLDQGQESALLDIGMASALPSVRQALYKRSGSFRSAEEKQSRSHNAFLLAIKEVVKHMRRADELFAAGRSTADVWNSARLRVGDCFGDEP